MAKRRINDKLLLEPMMDTFTQEYKCDTRSRHVVML